MIVGVLNDVFNTTQSNHHNLRFRMNKNLRYKFVLLTVLEFGPNGGFHKYYPRMADYEVVRPGTDYVFEISRTMPHRRADRETATFKAFITTVPAPFDVLGSLTKRNIPAGSRNNEFGANRIAPEPLIPDTVTEEAWLTFKNTELTDEELRDPVEMWRTLSVTIHTTV